MCMHPCTYVVTWMYAHTYVVTPKQSKAIEYRNSDCK